MSTNDWSIRELVLHNFRSYKDFTITFGREVTLLIGENGAGKTAVLEALAIMLWTPLRQLSGDGRGAQHFRPKDARRTPADLPSQERQATAEQHFPVQASLDAMVNGSELQWDRELRSATGHTTWGSQKVRTYSESLITEATQGPGDVTLPVIAAYGVERLLSKVPAKSKIPTSRRSAYDLALDPRSDVTRLGGMLRLLDEQILRAQAFGDPEPAAALRQFDAIRTACNRILEPVGWHSPRWDSTVDEITFRHNEQGTLPLTMLATGTKIAAGLAIDLSSRMARANPHLGAEDLLEQTPGIVLVDEVDLHLHPKWQRKIVPALRQTFPRVQFILTTHSPQVISTVEAENIRILPGGTATEPGRVDYSEGVLPNIILEDIQGTDPRPDVQIRNILTKYMALVRDGQGTTDLAISLREQLEDKGGEQAFHELVDADTIIEIESWED